MVACYVSIDDLKKTILGYSPEHAEEFQEESAKLANNIFTEKLKTESCENVILLSGGSASGKTEFYSEYLVQEDCIVFDSTLPTIEGAQIKIRQIRKVKKNPVLYAIIPDDLCRSFAAFHGRDRLFSDKHFYRTHAGARSTLLWIAENEPDITIKIFESSYNDDKEELSFTFFSFFNRENMIDFLGAIQHTEDRIIDIVNKS